MKHGFKWTAMWLLLGIAGTVACSASESQSQSEDNSAHSSPAKANEGLAKSEGQPSVEPKPAIAADAGACGGPAQECCFGSSGEPFCSGNLQCRWDVDGTYCRQPDCGENGQTCCSFGLSCYSGASCGSDNRCHTCGGPGEACCSGSSGPQCNNEPLYRCAGDHCSCTGSPGCPVQ